MQFKQHQQSLQNMSRILLIRPDTSNQTGRSWVQKRWNISSKLVSLFHIVTSCQELAKCDCKRGCNRRCKYLNPGLTMRPHQL